MSQPVRQRLAQPLRFLSVGVVNTLVGLSIIYAAMVLLGFGHEAANALGYGCALVVSFLLNKAWTFRYRGRTLVAAAKFLGVIATAYSANLATVVALVDAAGISPYAAQVMGILPYTAITFLGSKYIAFREV